MSQEDKNLLIRVLLLIEFYPDSNLLWWEHVVPLLHMCRGLISGGGVNRQKFSDLLFRLEDVDDILEGD